MNKWKAFLNWKWTGFISLGVVAVSVCPLIVGASVGSLPILVFGILLFTFGFYLLPAKEFE